MGETINLVENFKVDKVIFNCGIYNELEKPKLEQYKETLDVINSFELLNDDLREYLSKLEVIEGAN